MAYLPSTMLIMDLVKSLLRNITSKHAFNGILSHSSNCSTPFSVSQANFCHLLKKQNMPQLKNFKGRPELAYACLFSSGIVCHIVM